MQCLEVINWTEKMRMLRCDCFIVVIVGGVMIVLLLAVIVFGFITLFILQEPEGADLGERYSTGSGVGHQ